MEDTKEPTKATPGRPSNYPATDALADPAAPNRLDITKNSSEAIEQSAG